MAFSTWQDRELYHNYRRDRAGFQQWLIDGRSEANGASDQLETLISFLGPIFDYLADGHRFGVLERRAWILLYALRPDLLDGEDMTTASKRWGVSKPAVCYQLEHLRKALPNLVIDTDARKGHAMDKTASNERHRVANLKRHAERRGREAELRAEGFKKRIAASS